jgi:hypothetical protein
MALLAVALIFPIKRSKMVLGKLLDHLQFYCLARRITFLGDHCSNFYAYFGGLLQELRRSGTKIGTARAVGSKFKQDVYGNQRIHEKKAY